MKRRYDKPCELVPGKSVFMVTGDAVKRVTVQRMIGDGNAWTTCGEIVTPYKAFASQQQASLAHVRCLTERACFEAQRKADHARDAAVDVARRVYYGAATLADVKAAAAAVVEAEADVERHEAVLAKTPRPVEGWS